MKFSPAFIYKIRQVIALTIFWILVNALVELNNAIVYDPETRQHYFSFLFGGNAWEHLLITSLGPLLGGLITGTLIIFYLREKVKGKTYGRKLLIHSGLYLGFLIFIIPIVGLIGAIYNPAEVSYWQKLKEDIFSLRLLRLLITWYFIVIFTIFLLDVSEQYGTTRLKNRLLGKYHLPVREERIFMFLDLRSSTTIAEKIGEECYFRMLRFFYQVANEAVLNNHGEIYQYVGDEIVVSWEKKTGLQNANCLNCFYAVQEIIAKNATTFTNEYGVVPTFKAALHYGIVATGEIGTVKKDIVYSGDVLNTTARIIALCNQYGHSLMISGLLYGAIEDTKNYSFTFVDNPVLRGKSVKMDIYAVEKT